MASNKRSREGELLIDHRHSPGLTPADLAGFDAPAVAKGTLFESAIITCGHCQATVVLNPDRTRERGWCAKCDTYLCDECAYRLHLTLECNTFERRLDALANEIERYGTSPLLVNTRL